LFSRCHFPPRGTQVDCAVSGGPDSTALAVLATVHGLEVTVWHVDHGLRPGSRAEASLVEDLAKRIGAPFVGRNVDIAPGPNLSERARDARHGALPPGALLGHTADDQAETILINLLRGAGATGLGGMRPDHRRPILGLRRAETVALCSGLGLDVVDDPSNADPRYTRTRVRHEIVPLLQAVSGRDPVPVLVRQAGLLRDDDALLDDLAAALDPTDARAVAEAPTPLARRALRRWLTVSGRPPDAAAVERVLEVARGTAIGAEVEGGRAVRRTGGRLRVEPTRRPLDTGGPGR
jgi:tRNA(Ile)-lysidine synthase